MSGMVAQGEHRPFTPLVGGELLTATERDGLGRAGYGGVPRTTMSTPVLLVVDVTWGFCGRAPDAEDLAAAVDRYPHASGAAAWRAVPAVADLVAAARAAGYPIVFTRPARPAESPGRPTRWEDKNRRQRDVPADAFDLVPDIGAAPHDPVMHKETPSAFFGTPLRRWLTGWGADGVVICGGTTSGCVRATAVDAFSHDLSVTIAADATFDRISISHRVSLLDLELKYAEVVETPVILDRWRDRDVRAPEQGTGRRRRPTDAGGDAVPP